RACGVGAGSYQYFSSCVGIWPDGSGWPPGVRFLKGLLGDTPLMQSPEFEGAPWHRTVPVLRRWQIGCASPFALLFFLIAVSPFTISWGSRVVLGLPSALFFVWAVASREAARERKAEEEERRLDALIAAVDEHAATLRRKRRQLTRVDDYGVVFTEAWDREVGHFLKHVIAPVAGPNGMSFEETELVLEAIDEVSEEGSEGTGTV